MLASGPGGRTLVHEWVRRLVLTILLGDNDAHAKNIALKHRAHGTALAPASYIVPELFARDMIDEGFKMAFAVNGTFDHRQMSVDALVAEAQSPFYPDRRPALAQRIDAESLTKWRPGAAIGSENDS